MSRLGFEMQSLVEFRLFIGSGEYLICKEVCRRVSMTIQNTMIKEYLFVLSMGGANIVLGIQWLEKLGSVTTNYKELTMEFHDGDRHVILQGDPHVSESEISKEELRRLVARNEVAYFCHLRSENLDPGETQLIPRLTEILVEFKDVLAKPEGLPPERPTNHRIALIPGPEPVNVHPYWYPHHQKNENEKLINSGDDEPRSN